MLRLVATFWRYVRIQLVVFVFGIVGPIFLIIFFATQPDPSTKWAYWAGLFITAAEVLIALGITSASDPKKAPADARVALAVAKRRRSGSSHDSSSSSTNDRFCRPSSLRATPARRRTTTRRTTTARRRATTRRATPARRRATPARRRRATSSATSCRPQRWHRRTAAVLPAGRCARCRRGCGARKGR
jgi:hypothetical protein